MFPFAILVMLHLQTQWSVNKTQRWAQIRVYFDRDFNEYMRGSLKVPQRTILQYYHEHLPILSECVLKTRLHII